jgi:integrase
MRGLPPSRHEEPAFLTAQQVATLADAMPTTTARLLVYAAAYTGLRAGELAGLRRKDVDLLCGVVHVRQALKSVDGQDTQNGPVFGSTKTGNTRTVTLPRFLRAALNEHLTVGHPGDTNADALVFTSPEGAILRHGPFYRRVFKPAVRRALTRGATRLAASRPAAHVRQSAHRPRCAPEGHPGATRPREHHHDDEPLWASV